MLPSEFTDPTRPDLDVFRATASGASGAGRRRPSAFDLSGMGETYRLEWCYVLQCRHDERGAPVSPGTLSVLTRLVRRAPGASLLDRSLAEWSSLLAAADLEAGSHERALLRYAYARLEDLAAASDPDVLYGRDVWDARRLGIEAHRSPHRPLPSAVRASNESRQARLDALRAEIARLTEENRWLRQQAETLLGERRAAPRPGEAP
jgi:hypothetical protein